MRRPNAKAMGLLVQLVLIFAALAPAAALAPKVKDGSSRSQTVSVDAMKAGRKYMLTSFPQLKQVAYTVLPDNVWRPLVLGDVASPTAIAVDPLSSRLFVADPPKNIIWWYQLGATNKGLLQTVGRQRAAVEGFSAHWLAVNGAGDLYFSGHPAPKAGSNGTVDAIWLRDKMADCDTGSFVLGIDIGTTSIKVSLVRNGTKDVIESFRLDTEANNHDKESNFAEQDVAKIFACLQHVLSQFSLHFLAKVARIGICGQMHGCVMWNGESCSVSSEGHHFIRSDDVSHLITWEDGRCNNDFLSTLPPTRTHIPISTGFGCASIFWLQRNDPSFLERFDCAGTIMDYFVCVSCEMRKPCMSSHNAVSWGYFDVSNMAWELDILKEANFPTQLLPVVVEPGTMVGKLQRSLYGIPVGTPVGVGLGDFQCSVLASRSQESDAVLNIGTSCQLAVVVPANTSTVAAGESSYQSSEMPSKAITILPFFQRQKVMTAASLSGGNVLATFVKMLTSWMKDLGLEESLPSKDDIYSRILACADERASTSLQVVPTLWGERHTSDQRGQVNNLTSGNISLGDVGLALFKGVIENIKEMMTQDFLHLHDVRQIVGAGSALKRNRVLQKQVEQVFELPLVLNENADASVGAAIATLLERN